MNELLLRYKNELSAASIVLFFFFVLVAIFSSHATRMAQFKKKEIAFFENKADLERLLSLDQELKSMETRFLLRDYRSFLAAIEERARSLGVNISYLRPIQRERDLYQETEIDLGVGASLYKNLLDFISLFEEENVFIERLELNQKNEAKILLRGFIIK